MRRVVIESPYAGDIVANVRYAKRAMRDALARGESPLASHLLYAQPGILRDHVAEERAQGIAAGLAWAELADAVIVYQDRGVSSGMQQAIDAAHVAGIPIEYRRLDDG
jgi:hypothetical protein